MRKAAEELRNDPSHWYYGVVYRCRNDPRVIVRNHFWFGWTWNFGHRLVVPSILAAVLVFLGPLAALAAAGELTSLTLPLVAVLSLTVVITAAHYIASGPREQD